jgi:nucleotide-binding universal stress UspA family protein
MTGRRHSHFKKVLIEYDGSARSDKATESALALAQPLDSKVLLFAVARPPEPATMVEVDAMLDDAREHFEAHFKENRSTRKNSPRSRRSSCNWIPRQQETCRTLNASLHHLDTRDLEPSDEI